MNLKQKLYLSKTNKLHKQGLLNGLIKPFDEELYQELNKTIFLNIPVDLDIKYLKPEVRPGRCYDRSLAMFFAMAKSYLVRGSLEYFRIFGDEEDINHGWVERDNYVYDPTWRCIFDKDYYYKMFKVKKVNRLNHEEYCNISKEYEDLFIKVKSTTRDSLKENGPDRYMLPVSVPLLMGIAEENDSFKSELEKFLEEIEYDYDAIMKSMHEKLYEKTKK